MKVPGKFRKQALTNCEREQQRTHKGKCQRRAFQWVTGGRFQESSKRQTHIVGIVLIYVCVLDGNVTVGNIDAATLRNQGKCQRRVFQGVPGGGFQDSSKCEHLPLPVNVNNTSYTQEMSEKVLPGGHWRSFPGKFNK